MIASMRCWTQDFYDEKNTDGAAEVAKNRKFYEEEIFPRLRPRQKALFVPGVFASSPSHCASENVSCPLASQAEQIVIKLDGFFQWAKNDSRVAGFNPWSAAQALLGVWAALSRR